MRLFADALGLLGEVDTLVVAGFDLADARAQAEEQNGVHVIDATSRHDTQFQLLRRIADSDARLRAFRAYGRGSRHAALSAPVVAEIAQAAAHAWYDLVHIGRLYLADAVAAVADAPTTTLDFDEDDAAAWRIRAVGREPVEAAWMAAEADAEDRLIGRRADRFAGCFIASGIERDSMLARHPRLPLEVVPNTVRFGAGPRRADDGRTLLFVGTLGYAPNVEGLSWFISEVWPQLREAYPTAKLRIVGHAPPGWLIARDGTDQISVIADAPDVAPHYAEATLAIAPLLSGGGTRIKIIEAAAFGVPVVATSRALAGLDFADPQRQWVAETAEGFAAAILEALSDPAARERRARAATEAARADHDHAPVATRLAQRFRSLHERRATRVVR